MYQYTMVANKVLFFTCYLQNSATTVALIAKTSSKGQQLNTTIFTNWSVPTTSHVAQLSCEPSELGNLTNPLLMSPDDVIVSRVAV